jgi:hypothetical protein
MESWTTIRYYQQALEANYARCLLEAEGIPVFLKDEHTIATNPLWATTMGGIKLQVPTARKTDAESLLRTREDEPFGTSGENDDAPPACDTCGSGDLEGPFSTLRSGRGWLGFLVGAALYSYPLDYDRVYRCRECGKRTPVRGPRGGD